MAKREAANANAINQPFVPLFFVVSKRHDSKRIFERANPPNAATSFLELLTYQACTLKIRQKMLEKVVGEGSWSRSFGSSFFHQLSRAQWISSPFDIRG